jgi:uncharacterized protein (DUF1697 family)
MPTYIALLRAVNVGGTGKLPMADLVTICVAAGLANVRTYIASGNAVFDSEAGAAEIKAALEQRLASHAGKPVGVIVRSAAEMAEVLARNPFPDAPPHWTVALFLDAAPPEDTLERLKGQADERVHLGAREIYVAYGAGMARSRLKIPAAASGTARNLNTIAKLSQMANAT